MTDDREQLLTEHLQRATELLRGRETDAADTEVALALELGPTDARAQHLLALVRFRAGRYEEALDVYHRLARDNPDDPALRLNLGLVELRLGRPHEAAADLRVAVDREPANARARGYLGLALLRAGDLAGAHRELAAAGQERLAREVEERLALQAAQSDRLVAEVRRMAEEVLRAFDELDGEGRPFAAVDAEPPPASAPTDDDRAAASWAWQIRAPGSPPPVPGGEPTPDAGSFLEPLRLAPPQPMAEFATTRLLRAGTEGTAIAVAESGLLVLRVDGRLPTRTLGAVASMGRLSFEPLHRRVRGRASDDTFGVGLDALSVAVGHGSIVVAPAGGRFLPLALREEVLYARELLVYAFEESLLWENGRVPGSTVGGAGIEVVQFRGSGSVVLRTARAAFCVEVLPGETSYVDHTTLVGWIGRVVPRQLHGEDGALMPYLECSGEGALILEEPAPTA